MKGFPSGSFVGAIFAIALAYSTSTFADTTWGWRQAAKNPNSVGTSNSCQAAVNSYIAAFNGLPGSKWCQPGCAVDPCAANIAFSSALLGVVNSFDGSCPVSSCSPRAITINKQVCPGGQEGYYLSTGGAMACGGPRPTSCPSTENWDGDAEQCSSVCSDPNETASYLGQCALPAPPAKNAGQPPDCQDNCGNPIKPGSGQKYQREAVLNTPTFNLELTYNSVPVKKMPVRPYAFGNGWTSTYGSHVWIVGTSKAAALRPDGKFYQFLAPASGHVFIPEADVPDLLTRVVNGSGQITGWQYRVGADYSLENYNGEGNLTSIVKRTGETTTLTYSTGATSPSIAPWPGLLVTVTDHFGRTLQFVHDSSGRVKQVTNPNGSVFKFYYDEASSVVLSGQPLGNNLTSIEFPGTQKRVFHYNEQAYTASTNLPNALTGVTDENSNRYSIFQYDSSARAVSTALAGGADAHAVTYNVNGTRTVVDPLSTSRTNSYQTVVGVTHTTAVSGPACPLVALRVRLTMPMDSWPLERTGTGTSLRIPVPTRTVG